MALLVGETAQAVVRALLFAGIMGVVGGTLFAYRLAPAFDGEALQAEARVGAKRVLRLAGVLLSVVVAWRLVQQAAAFADAPELWRSAVGLVITKTTWGTGWLVQAVAVPLVLASALRERSSGGVAPFTLGAGLLALAASPALSGHAIGAPRLATVAVVLDTVHVVAAGAWLGTLAVVAWVALPLARRAPDGTMLRVLARFSPIALASAAALAASGVFASWLHLESLQALWSTDYGMMLVRKLVVLAGVAVTGAYNWKVVTPRLTTAAGLPSLRRSVAIELSLAVVLVAITAVLVATPLPAEG
jgi:putative copper export protein